MSSTTTTTTSSLPSSAASSLPSTTSQTIPTTPLPTVPPTWSPPASCQATTAWYQVVAASDYYDDVFAVPTLNYQGLNPTGDCVPPGFTTNAPYVTGAGGADSCPSGYTSACNAQTTYESAEAELVTCCPSVSQWSFACYPLYSDFSYGCGTIGTAGASWTGHRVDSRSPDAISTYAITTSLESDKGMWAYGVVMLATSSSSSAPSSSETGGGGDGSGSGSGSSGLSTGAAAGIGVGVAVGVIAVAAVAAWLFFRRRRQLRDAEKAGGEAEEEKERQYQMAQQQQQQQQQQPPSEAEAGGIKDDWGRSPPPPSELHGTGVLAELPPSRGDTAELP